MIFSTCRSSYVRWRALVISQLMKTKALIQSFSFVLASLLCAGCGGDSSGEFEYVAVGASDATGVGASPLTNGYVFRIQDALKADGYDVGLTNLGIPGGQTDDIKQLSDGLSDAINPELITVFVGSNDIVAGITPESFRNDLDSMLEHFQSGTQALVVIANLPDLTTLPRFVEEPDPDVTPERIAAFNAIIADRAAAHGAKLVDLFSEPIQSFDVSGDGFHPSDSGHERLAGYFLNVIRPNLPPPGSV